MRVDSGDACPRRFCRASSRIPLSHISVAWVWRLCLQRHSRHTAATRLHQAGVELNTIRGWLGHVSLDTTNIYTEVDFESKAKALAACEIRPTRFRKKQLDIVDFLRRI